MFNAYKMGESIHRVRSDDYGGGRWGSKRCKNEYALRRGLRYKWYRNPFTARTYCQLGIEAETAAAACMSLLCTGKNAACIATRSDSGQH